jgi:thiazole synthase ThiGH ThiG subunit
LKKGFRLYPSRWTRLLAAERRAAAGRPAHHPGALVGRADHDGVGDAEVIELLQKLADVPVVLDHAVGIDPEAGLALRLGLEVG